MSTAFHASPLLTARHHAIQHKVGMPFPPDRRERIQQTTQAPWSGIGLVSATFPSGDVFESTGFVIDSRLVITVAHAIFNTAVGGNATSVVFECARDAAKTPFGIVAAKTWHKPAEYPTGGRPYDYSLLELDRALPSAVSRYRLVAASDEELEAGWFQIAGYPDDKVPENSMWFDSGKLLEPPESRVLRYRISTSAGQSGAAVSSYLDAISTDVVGIHAGAARDSRSNEAVRVTEAVLEQVAAWRNG